jgi:hypothetical protein
LAVAVLRPALRPVRGSWRLVALRTALVVASSVPALLVAWRDLGPPSRRPYFTEVDGRLPVVELLRLLAHLSDGFAVAAALGLLFAVGAGTLLNGGALAWLAPEDPPREGVVGAVTREGGRHLWPLVRAQAVTLGLMALGLAAIGALFGALDRAAETGHWSGYTRLVVLGGLRVAATALWLAGAGAWHLWCAALTVADGRRRVRRTGLLVLRVWWRHPLRTVGFFAGVTLLAVLVSGAVLVAWRQLPPSGGFGVAWRALLWLATLTAHAWAWHWLLRAARLLYALPGLDDVRKAPDEPFRLLRRALARLRRRQGAATAPSRG